MTLFDVFRRIIGILDILFADCVRPSFTQKLFLS
jgi:hypothetical protein